MQSLPKLFLSQHSRPFSGTCRGRHTRLPREQTRRRSLASLWRGGGASGSGGSGGRDDGSFGFGDGDGDGFYPQDFDFLAALTLLSEKDRLKVPCYTIAAGNGEEQEVVEKEEEEESEAIYVKPAPKPKPLSLSLQPGLSWMLMLLLLSGGVFLWRRSRNRNAAPQEESDANALIQRTREIQMESLPDQQAEPGTQETEQDGQREGGHTPDFAKELEEQDVLFDVDRDVKIEKQPSGIESANPSEQSLPEKTEAPPKTSESPAVADVVPSPPPAAFQDARETDLPVETYYQDLDDKDAHFPDERMSEKKEPVSEPASALDPAPAAVPAPSPTITAVAAPAPAPAPAPENPETIKLVFKFMEVHSTKELEKELCTRWVLSPTSQNDEGSNQSAATHFSGARSFTTEAHEPDSPPSEKEGEDYDFEHLPKKYALIEEDLGPPIKPTTVDFTKPSEWEHEAPGTIPKGARTDERSQTMQYLLSHAELLAEALKAMDSGPAPVSEAKMMHQLPDIALAKASKKSKKKKSKKKRAAVASH